jgi:hypothetical protein
MYIILIIFCFVYMFILLIQRFFRFTVYCGFKKLLSIKCASSLYISGWNQLSLRGKINSLCSSFISESSTSCGFNSSSKSSILFNIYVLFFILQGILYEIIGLSKKKMWWKKYKNLFYYWKHYILLYWKYGFLLYSMI